MQARVRGARSHPDPLLLLASAPRKLLFLQLRRWARRVMSWARPRAASQTKLAGLQEGSAEYRAALGELHTRAATKALEVRASRAGAGDATPRSPAPAHSRAPADREAARRRLQ